MSDEQQSLLKRIRRPLILATVGAVFLAFVAWFGPQLRDDLWFMRFEEGCNRGDPDACAGVGWRYLIGSGTGMDRARGHAMLDDACRNHDILWACAAVGNTHWWDKDAQFLLTNEQTENARRECQEGINEACDLVNTVGLDVPEPVEATKSLERCLDDDAVACWAVLDQVYQAASSEDRDAICALGVSHACPGALREDDGEAVFERLHWRKVRTSFEHRVERHKLLDSWVAGEFDTDTAIERLSKLCRKDGASCELAAKLRAKRAGVIELAQDWELTRPYYHRACKAESRWGCWGLGKYRERVWWGADVTKDKIPNYYAMPPSEAFNRACLLGYHRSCVDAAEWYSYEHRNASFYRRELEKMCKRNVVEACDALILELREGQYGPADPERAQTVQQAVCDAGSEDHCDHWLFGTRRP